MKEVQLVAQAFKELIQPRRLNSNSKYHLSVGLLWRHRLSRFSMSQFWTRFPTDLKPIVCSKCHPSYSYQTLTDLVYNQKAITPRCPNSPRLPPVRKNTLQVCFESKTGDFNKFQRQIPYCDLQRQSFTNTFINLSLNIRIYCSNVIYRPVLSLGSLWWQAEPHQYTAELTSLRNHYYKCINLHLQKFSCKT